MGYRGYSWHLPVIGWAILGVWQWGANGHVSMQTSEGGGHGQKGWGTGIGWHLPAVRPGNFRHVQVGASQCK